MTDLTAHNLSAEDRVWAAKAREEQAAALSNLRATAEKWAAALTTALGVVSLAALLQGPKVFEPLSGASETCAKVAFFAAAVAALAAIVLATLAAQQSHTRLLARSGTEYRKWATEQVERWRFWLSFSRWLAALAVAGVLVAASFVWFGDRASEGPAVIDGRGSVLCPAAPGAKPKAGGSAKYVIVCGP